MFVAAGTDTVLFAISTLVGVAGALGVAYTVFRSASEQRLREVDQHIINNQNLLMGQLEKEMEKCRSDLAVAAQRADSYREALTQKAAVDHLAEIIAREERSRRAEHDDQMRRLEELTVLANRIIAFTKRRREDFDGTDH